MSNLMDSKKAKVVLAVIAAIGLMVTTGKLDPIVGAICITTAGCVYKLGQSLVDCVKEWKKSVSS